MTVYSTASPTDVYVQCGSVMGAVEGEKILNGNRYSYYNQSTAVGSASYVPLLTIYNSLYFNGTSNQCVINLTSVCAALKHTSPCIIFNQKWKFNRKS